ncbi:hypothetical protein CEP54_014114 [Fusarium duplospermum]|uniref:SUR7 protein n=1 Tax=Fusarium duplospermum TaxID=1325734 RepID=A0A428NYM9_9HYPO|nr:hypothetical protein CEP54_014114 [Fusarium duplospermum]
MFSRLKSIILFLIHGVLIISLLVFTLKLLSDTKNEKEGIFKISFERHVFIRGLPNPIQSIHAQATHVIDDAGDVADKATSAVARATKVADEIKNKATSAIAAGETFINGLIPKACSVGTKYGCVEFNSRSDCVEFPMKDGNAFDKITDISTTVKPLKGILHHIPSLQVFLSVGVILILVSSIISVASSLGFVFPLKSLTNIILSGLGLAAFCSFTGIVMSIYTNGLDLEDLTGGTLHRGFAYTGSISLAVISFLHFVVVMAEAVIGCIWL